MRAILKISPHIAPVYKWQWDIVFDNGHIWKTSRTFDSLDECIGDIEANGQYELVSALALPD